MLTPFAWDRKIMPVSRLKLGIATGCLLGAMIAAGAGYADAGIGAGPAPLSTLVKYGDREYEVTAADWVSLAPLSSATVRKIAHGRISEVSVATTATGTYSSDGMVSPHIRYPGITVRPGPAAETGRPGWVRVPGTYMFTFARSPWGQDVFNALTPQGSMICLALGDGATCSVR